MTDTLNITTVDDPVTRFFWVLLENRCVATFYYCTEGEEGLFTKKQAKKLTEKLVRKIEKSTTIKTKKDLNSLNGKGTTITNNKYLLETFLMEYLRAGIIAVIHRNYRIAMFPYHRNEDEKGLPTRDFALEMAIELRDKIKKCTTEESDTGITFVEKEQPIFND